MQRSTRKTRRTPRPLPDTQAVTRPLLDRVRNALLRDSPVGDRVVEHADLAEGQIPAAVLMAIVLRESPTLLLTKRTSHLRDHPGQISFPGGRIEHSDPSPMFAALREAEEEVGLKREFVDVIGYLPRYVTGTGFEVTPVVSLVRPPLDLRGDPFEVAEIFEVPLDFLLDASNHQRMAIHHQGRKRAFYSIPYGEYFIWGATAGMIRALYDRLQAAD
jgi:8-oxo-dGTP pyrophosphatase MutT (NUDIX family)